LLRMLASFAWFCSLSSDFPRVDRPEGNKLCGMVLSLRPSSVHFAWIGMCFALVAWSWPDAIPVPAYRRGRVLLDGAGLRRGCNRAADVQWKRKRAGKCPVGRAPRKNPGQLRDQINGPGLRRPALLPPPGLAHGGLVHDVTPPWLLQLF
jgi:hypothetical protein